MTAYRSLASFYLKKHPYCEIGSCMNEAGQIHHIRGRSKDFLCDTRYWLAVCIGCHDWIHSNMKKARELRLILPPL